MDTKQAVGRSWRHRTGTIELGQRTVLMGIVNVTPDSFSDGGKFLDVNSAVDHALKLCAEGADILDLGAESTRPGSDPVSTLEQLRRLIPIMERLVGTVRIPISIDTTSADVAGECLKSGASIINDISGFHWDSGLPDLCAKYEAGVVLMHISGKPKIMQVAPAYTDLLADVHHYLSEGVQRAIAADIKTDQIVVDPGIGFGKNFEQNYRLLGHVTTFMNLGVGVLVGPSRKAFTGEFNKLPADQRQYSTAAAVAIAAMNGADILRVHDVKEMRQVTDIVDRFRELEGNAKS